MVVEEVRIQLLDRRGLNTALLRHSTVLVEHCAV